MNVDDARTDIARRNKKGIAFVLSSIILWALILVVWLLPIRDVQMRDLLTFFCTAPLMPLAFLFSKIVGAEFSAKDNPLNKLGILFSMNQLLYILIAMWAMAAVPDKMVMLLAMVFGAHLLPFSWLYKSRAYMVMSTVIPLVILFAGYGLSADRVFTLPAIMLAAEIAFSFWLFLENRIIAAGD